MVKVQTKTPIVEETASTKNRKPDYTVLLRQQPEMRADGQMYRSDNMSIVGAAWKSEKMDKDTGEMIEYIGIKAHVKFEVGPEGLLLRTYKDRA